MGILNKLINNRFCALIIIIALTVTLIKFHQITGYISKTALTTQSFLSTYIAILFLGIIIITIYWVYKIN